MIQSSDIDILKKSLPFWNNLKGKQQEMIISNSQIITYKKGEFLHCTERDCLGVLVIKSGTLRTFITSEEGREITLYLETAGDVSILSASCVLDTITFDVTMDADTDCEVIQICSQLFARLQKENVHVELFSYKQATERFSDVMWAMQEILFTSFDKRLAAFLIDEIRKTKQDTISLTHEQIAKYLGSAREVVSRMLKYFSRQGLVELSRGGIKILDESALIKML